MVDTHYNAQTLTKSNISVQNCKIYMDANAQPESVGVTPTTELGFFANVTFNPTAEQVKMYTGSPAMLKDVFVGKEDAAIDIECDEHFYQTYCRAMSTGLCTTSGRGSYSQGGLMQTSKVGILVEHILVGGNPMYIYLWKCVGTGVLPLSFAKGSGTEHNKYKIGFNVLFQETDWADAPLSRGQFLYHIEF